MWAVGLLIFIVCFIFMVDIGIIIDLLFNLIINKVFPEKDKTNTQSFVGSLYYMGLKGGNLSIDEKNFYFKHKSASTPDEFKNLVIPLRSITKIEQARVFFLPAVILHAGNYKTYKFVVFNRPLFLKMADPNYQSDDMEK